MGPYVWPVSFFVGRPIYRLTQIWGVKFGARPQIEHRIFGPILVCFWQYFDDLGPIWGLFWPLFARF